MALMLKPRLVCRERAIKVLDYALQGSEEECITFVQASGLKGLFQLLTSPTLVSFHKSATSEDANHCLGVISSLLTFLPAESIERIRLLAKFVADSYTAVDRLVEIRGLATSRLRIIDDRFSKTRYFWL